MINKMPPMKMSRKEIRYGLMCNEQDYEFSKYSCNNMKMYYLEMCCEFLDIEIKYKKATKLIKLDYSLVEVIKHSQKKS